MCCSVFGLEPDEVVVVYNADSDKSCDAMRRYCTGRGIPKKHRLPLRGLKRGDISRAQYDTEVKNPLLVLTEERGLVLPAGPQREGKKIKAMVLMPDLPLRIQEAAPKGRGQKVNAAALDSELMLLGAEYPLAGFGRNPYYGKPALPSGNERQVVMCVCRIDGPDDDCIKRMIDDPRRIEKSGLWGWTVVDTGGPYKQGDAMIEAVADACIKNRMPLFYEKSKSTIAKDYPLMQNVICYCGWYINPPDGPFRKKSETAFKFARGAIAFHLHSFSATSIYNGETWVSALLQRGACVTAGNVAEPYLGPSLNCGLFFVHLFDGKTVGEAALLASPSVSWHCIVLGDPLYRPFPRSGGITPDKSSPFVRWRVAVNRTKGSLDALQATVDMEKYSSYGPLFAEIFAGLCRAEGRLQDAERYYRYAAENYTPLRDRLRASCLLAYTLQALKRTDDAALLTKDVQKKYGKSPYAEAVKKLLKDIPPKK